MIKIEDIRYGNIVLRTGHGSWLAGALNTPIELCGITFEEVVRHEEFREIYSYIPLTPEWLERCGFINEDMHDLGIYTYLRINIEISLSWNDKSIWIGEYDTKIKHLHQLQNLYFALTNTELNINL